MTSQPPPTTRLLWAVTALAAVLVLDIVAALWPSRWVVLTAVGIAGGLLAGMLWATVAAAITDAQTARRAAATRRVTDQFGGWFTEPPR